ncbi:MAG: replication factor C large subunit [Sulfolobales archaeon]|nr:replication factor C large subunit [Ignisphaera sp.]MCX8199777.1 replication factor C large subunit [Sulfolobales archaeon]MDW8084984.1 replication factor C large subunit [Ignisphaera sp.]
MNYERRIPWTVKYRPKNLMEVVNQEEAKAKIVEWLSKWPNVSKKALLLYGPPGCGKTSLVEAIANEYVYELIEMNASDFRRKTDIERIALKASTSHSLFGFSKKIVLLDEIDGISVREDEGALEAIQELIEKTNIPVIMTANNPWDQNLRILRNLAEFVQFRKLTKTDMRGLLMKICKAEKIVCSEDAINYIIERSEGDLRAAINDLQSVGEGSSEVTLERTKLLLRPRDKEKDPFETLRSIFSANYAWQAKAVTNQTQLDYEQLKMWLEENIPLQYTDLEDLARAFDSLSRADLYMGRIVKTGDWDLLSYAIDLMTAGVALSAKNNSKDKYRWVKYNFPQRILKASGLKEVRSIRDDLAQTLAQHLHVSTSIAKSEIIPLLKTIFSTNPLKAAKIALGLGFTERMIEYLAGTNKSTILEYYRELKKNMLLYYQSKHSKPVENNEMHKKEVDNLNKDSKKERDLLAFSKKR